MALTTSLDLRQNQSLVMTPQLQQAIKLLQLNNIELSTFVEQEIEQNPLLERDEQDGSEITDNLAEELPYDVVSEEVPLIDNLPGQTDEPALDIDCDNIWTNNSTMDDANQSESWGNNSSTGRKTSSDNASESESENSLENMLPREISLRDHLLGQINMDISDAKDRLIALHLLEMIDESGYLTSEWTEIAAYLECSLAMVERVVLIVQKFDPPGIFARNLAECLTLQLQDKNRYDPAMQKLLANLGLLAKGEFSQLMRVCGVDADDLTEMITEIRALDPKPALIFDHALPQPIVPDILMRQISGGGWHIELNSDTLPRLLLNTRYFSEVMGSVRNKEEKNYLMDRYQNANWLVKSLHQRATTILKVVTEIVRQQEDFFASGIEFLRPLVLRDISLAIEMHESTVSRVTSNKYLATPRGTYELKYFFTQAISNSSGSESHSAEFVRHRIKTLIDNEAPNKILSDDKIVEIIKSDGIDIARRTVAKYRESMNIFSSIQRRRNKSRK